LHAQLTDILSRALLLLAMAGPLASLLGLPAPLLRYAGLLPVPFVVLVAWRAREQTPRHVVRTLTGAHVLWVVASVLLLLSAG
jgi:hypothetical protein